MICKKTFNITNWRIWDDEINAAVAEFKKCFLVYPNILLANSPTLYRIDMAAKKGNLKDSENIPPPDENQYCSISGFAHNDEYNLEFCIMADLPDKYFSLIYDSNPDDDGEPIPLEDTFIFERRKKNVA